MTPAGVLGQNTPDSAGDIVRIWAPIQELVAARRVVHAVQQDSLDLVYYTGGPQLTTVVWTDIRRLDVQLGRCSRWRAALLWGFGVSMASAMATGSLAREPSNRELTVPLAGWIGFGIGTFFGSLRDPTKWVTVSVLRP
jgi:hypothetical protein